MAIKSLKRLAILSSAPLLLFLLYSFSPSQAVQEPLKNPKGRLLTKIEQEKLTELIFNAARRNDQGTIAEYLSEDFTPNLRSKKGDTLLIVAAYLGSKDVVQLLIKHPQIKLEAHGRMGLTAVSAAAFKGHNDILESLLSAGANPNATNLSQQTAIMFASLTGKSEAVKLLLKYGAQRDAQDKQGNSALTLAKEQGSNDVVTILEDPE